MVTSPVWSPAAAAVAAATTTMTAAVLDRSCCQQRTATRKPSSFTPATRRTTTTCNHNSKNSNRGPPTATRKCARQDGRRHRGLCRNGPPPTPRAPMIVHSIFLLLLFVGCPVLGLAGIASWLLGWWRCRCWCSCCEWRTYWIAWRRGCQSNAERLAFPLRAREDTHAHAHTYMHTHTHARTHTHAHT